MGLSTKIDARPCNIAPEGNNIFPGRFFVKVKEASRIFLITLWWADKLAQIVCSDTNITSRVKGKHFFPAQNDPKKMEIPFLCKYHFNGKIFFHVPLRSFQGAKIDIGQNSTEIGSEKNSVNINFVFSSCQEEPLGFSLSFPNSLTTGLQTPFLDWTNAKRIIVI